MLFFHFCSWCGGRSDSAMINHWATSQYKWVWGLSLYSYKLRSSQRTTAETADAEMTERVVGAAAAAFNSGDF